MADGKLIFLRPASGSGKLVLGDAPEGSVVPDAGLSIDAGFAGEGAANVRLVYGVPLGVDVGFAGEGAADLQLLWDSNVSRGGLRHELRSHWQPAQALAVATAAPWQQAQPERLAAQARWQQGEARSGAVRAPWREAGRVRAAAATHWQQGQLRRAAVDVLWQEAERLRAAVLTRWQAASTRRAAARVHWQEMLRLRGADRSHWQQGQQRHVHLATRYGDGLPVRLPLRPHWQEAWRPRSGVSVLPKPPAPALCYDPARLGLLVFGTPYRGDGRLVFVCNHGEVLPPAGVVVLPRRSYIMINSVEIRRADELAGDPLPSDAFSMQLDRQSWTWNFSASFHATASDAVAPGLNGEPVELEVRVNGVPYRMLGERFTASRRLPENVVRVSGRGKAALLDDKINPVRTFTSAVDRTASQLMTDALTINGVGFGWSVDFGLEDWLVTAGAWMHQGTYISALAEIAGAAGGYLQPHNTDAVIRVLPAWPKPWWEWGQLVPDIELPAGLSEIDDTDIVDRPLYNRIFVGGESYGVTADLTRTGTNGDLLKQPGVVHPLITGMDVAKQRARAELSVSGRSLVHKMTLPVLGQTGVIKPGVVLRYHDHANALRTGIVRSTNVSMQFPVLTQSLEVESHA